MESLHIIDPFAKHRLQCFNEDTCRTLHLPNTWIRLGLGTDWVAALLKRTWDPGGHGPVG